MNRFGLLESDIAYLTQLFIKYDEIQDVIIFGSRAKGNYKNGSDVDIAIKSKELSIKALNEIDNELNEISNLPYKFDLVHYEKIQTPELKEHIDRVGKKLITTHAKN
jgi:predicted nucleotidyltransferase